MTIPVEFREVLVCDDVRREDNGKALLIGVYVGEILVSSFPSSLRLSFWLQGRPRIGAHAGEARFKIEVTDQGSEQIPTVFAETRFDAPPPDTTGGILVLTAVPVLVKQPGRLVLSVEEEKDEWIELVSKRIGLLTTSSETSQPS